MAVPGGVDGLKRGALARHHGCNIETIRYYENIGLMRPPGRTASGHRLYSKDDQARLGFILRARELGFSVEDVRSLANLAQSHDYTCGNILALTERHLQDVRNRIRDLRRLEQSLAAISDQCGGGDAPVCPIMDALHDNGQPPADPSARSLL